MKFKVTLLPGDGIGTEVIDAAAVVLSAVERKYGHDFGLNKMPIGGSAIDLTGVPLPDETRKECLSSDAVLLGAVGGGKWDSLQSHMRPERGILSLRTEMKLFASLCPVVLHSYSKIKTGAIKPELTVNGVDIMLVRELSGGMYFGDHGYRDGALGQEAFDSEVYSINEIERVTKIAFELAATRRKHVTSVDRADLLTTGKLWKATVERVGKNYDGIKLDRMLVNHCAYKLIAAPTEFDVIVTSNIFGAILSSELAALCGSTGMIPSGEIGVGKAGLYEPIHGSAQDIAGKDLANPIGAILSAAMMLSMSLELETEAMAVDKAVRKALEKGLRTHDIAGGKKYVSCSRMAEEISMNILNG